MIFQKEYNNAPSLLICDDDLAIHLGLKSVFKKNFKISSAYSGAEALVLLKNKKIDLVLLDIEITSPKEGIELIPKIKDIDPEVLIIMMSGRNDFNTVKDALKSGADDFLRKSIEKDEILLTLNQNLEKKYLVKKKLQTQFELKTIRKNTTPLIGKSQGIENLRKTIEKLKKTNANILIYGETGSGKEVIARQLSKTLDHENEDVLPFITVDSSTIQSSMAESILFGHEKGSFTGAFETKKGLFEHADGGILYFDEIANMPLDIQNKLLRVLQEKEILRIGSSKVIPLDFKIICATNKNLKTLCEEGLFKDDLYQRLNVIPLFIPPLRERKEDIPLLIDYFLQKEKKEELRFSPETLEILMNYSWPGNVRELSNTLLYVCAMADGNLITPEALPPRFRSVMENLNKNPEISDQTLEKKQYHDVMKSFEIDFLKKTYIQFNGNISQMSHSIKVDRSHLFQKLKNLGIHSPK